MVIKEINLILAQKHIIQRHLEVIKKGKNYKN